MTDMPCSCPPGRPLGSPHYPGCQAYEGTSMREVVSIYRNPATQRPVAVPDEIVTEAEREYRAYKAHVEGKSWTDIAISEGYDSPVAASQAVRRYLDEGKAVVGDFRRQEVIAVEAGRLNALRAAVWPSAMEGKIPSVMAALAIHDRWAKLAKLDAVDDSDDLSGQTVVVPSADYIAGLRAVSSGPEVAAG